MLTGRPLFEGSLTRVVTQHILQPPPMEKLTWLPPQVMTLLESMLAKNADERPPNARELRSRLQSCLGSLEAPRALTVPPLGETLAGRFQIQAAISPGGVLQRATDTTGPRTVLVAVLPADAVPDAAALEVLDRDLRELQKHPHPALLAPLERLRDGARTIISFEWIDGITMAEAVSAQGRFALVDVVRNTVRRWPPGPITRRDGACTGSNLPSTPNPPPIPQHRSGNCEALHPHPRSR